MPIIGSIMMCVSVVVLLCGMLLGIAMGIREDFVLQPAHAHLNLLGGVMLLLFGLYYRVVPSAGASRLAKFQGWLHIVSGILLPAGIAVVVTHGNAFVALPVVGSLIMLVAMALFAVIVFGTAPVSPGRGHIFSPIRGIVGEPIRPRFDLPTHLKNHA